MHAVDQAGAQQRRREAAAALDQTLVHAELAERPPGRARSRCAPRLRTGTTRAPARSSRLRARAGASRAQAGSRPAGLARRSSMRAPRACAGASRRPRAAGAQRSRPPRRARELRDRPRAAVSEPTAIASVRARRRVHQRARGLGGDPARLAARGGDPAVEARGELQGGERPAAQHARDEALVVARARRRAARRARPRCPRARAAHARAARARIGIDRARSPRASGRAAITASTQGGVRPQCAQGSSVT